MMKAILFWVLSLDFKRLCMILILLLELSHYHQLNKSMLSFLRIRDHVGAKTSSSSWAILVQSALSQLGATANAWASTFWKRWAQSRLAKLPSSPAHLWTSKCFKPLSFVVFCYTAICNCYNKQCLLWVEDKIDVHLPSLWQLPSLIFFSIPAPFPLSHVHNSGSIVLGFKHSLGQLRSVIPQMVGWGQELNAQSFC